MSNLIFISNYQRYEKALNNFALKLTRNRNDAEDLVQESTLKAYKSFHTFKRGSNFKSWAFTIIKNTFISNYRRKRTRNEVNSPVEDLIYLYDTKSNTNNAGYHNLTIQEIKSQISNLSDKCRIPFLMSVEGYQYDEIAKYLDIPMGTVKSRINFARKKLKQSIQR